jgi:hypothetical protein
MTAGLVGSAHNAGFLREPLPALAGLTEEEAAFHVFRHPLSSFWPHTIP